MCTRQAHCVCVDDMKKEFTKYKELVAKCESGCSHSHAESVHPVRVPFADEKEHRKLSHNLFSLGRDTFKPAQAQQVQGPPCLLHQPLAV